MRRHIIFGILLSPLLSINAQEYKMTTSLNRYSLDSYNQLTTDSKNVFISPLSTYMALLVAYEGAKNETKEEFKKVLHIDNDETLSSLDVFYKNLIKNRDSSNKLNISNAIWVQKNFSIKTEYKNSIRQKYTSDLKTIDFKQKSNAIKEINDWVANKTNHQIKNIVGPDDINDYTRLIISNAIHFNGKWDDEFDKKLTKPDSFYSMDQSIAEVDFMNKKEYLSYYENNDFQFISKPYKNNDISFCIVLPKKRYGLNGIEKELTKSTIDTILNYTDFFEVELSIPKFRQETECSLTEPLKNLGLEKAFNPEADFSGITDREPLMIHKVIHKAFIEVEEEKTEAAAATVIVMEAGSQILGSKTKIFKADHPFTFFIIDNRTKGILFIGRYVQAG